MDLELLLRACWRQRWALVAAAVIGALLVAGGGKLVLSPKYASSADISVSPVFPVGSTTPEATAYSQDPDRYVTTQVELLLAQELASRVADQEHLATQDVVNAIKVAQVDKADVIRVTATTTDPKLSQRMAQQLVNDYISDSTAATAQVYQKALASIQTQLDGVSDSIDSTTKAIQKAGLNPSSPGPLQSELNSDIQSQQSLVTQQQQQEVQAESNPTSATLVSAAAINPRAVGPGSKLLAIYGAALGLAVALSLIAIANRPGQTLDDFDGVTEFGGTPMLGVVTPTRNWRIPAVGRPPAIEELRNMRVADEITNIVQLKGSVQFVLVGPPGFARRIKKSLAPLVLSPTSPEQLGGDAVARRNRRPADVGEFTVLSLATFLPGQVTRGVVVLGIGLDRVTRSQLDDVLAGLSGIGAEVLGIVGIR